MFHPQECEETSVSELFNQFNTQVLLVEVSPGGEIPPHYHQVACTIHILSGSGVWFDGTSYQPVEAGDVYHKEAGQIHGFSQIGEAGLKFTSTSYGKGLVSGQELDFARAS